MSLTLHEVGHRYPGAIEPALASVSCAFEPGRFAVVIGPNAAGKTTLLRIASGVTRPTSGSAQLNGTAIGSLRPAERAARLAYLAQKPTLAAGFTVRRVLELGRYALGADRGAVDRALERAELTHLASRGFHELSAGQQQRVTLARALAQLDPWGSKAAPHARFLIADEPTSAMDPRHGLETLSIFRELTMAGIGVVAALHDLTSAVRFADAALVLSGGGRVAAAGDVSRAMTPDILRSVYRVPFEVIGSPAGSIVTPVRGSTEAAS